jgi:hypothetical protein
MIFLKCLFDCLAHRRTNPNDDGDQIRHAISNFENSVLRFEYELLLAEYQSLREEIISRLSIQQQIINFSIAVIATMFAITQLLPLIRSDLIIRLVPLTYPLLSITFSAFALMYAEQDFLVVDIATYINSRLRPRIEALLFQLPNINPKIWEWEEFRGETHYRTGRYSLVYHVMSAARYMVMIIPSYGLLLIYWLGRQPTSHIPVLEIAIVALAVLLAVWILITLFVMRRKFLSIV